LQTRVQVPHAHIVFQYHVQIQIGIFMGRSVGLRAEEIYLFNRDGVNNEFGEFILFRLDCFVHIFNYYTFRTRIQYLVHAIFW
jgi:hypothetical protein